MSKYSSYAERVAQDQVTFHVSYLVELLKFLESRGMGRRDELVQHRGQKLLSEPLWKISEANLLPQPKYNLRFYSERAHDLARKQDRVLTPTKHCRVEHEHVVPRQRLENMLLEARGQPSEIRRLALLSVGCVTIPDEHIRLKDDPWGNEDPSTDPWRRYREAKDGPVRVWDRTVGDWVDLSGKTGFAS